MKGNVMPSIVEMKPELLKSLETEVNETIADNMEESETPHRSFSIVDLWNIRKNSNSIRNRFRG
jgi:hypothetical protein